MKYHTNFCWNSARFLVLCFPLAFTASCGTRSDTAGDTKADENAIRQQVAKYTAALDAADTGIASQVWLTTPEASFISPMGHSHGWEEVKKVYDFFGTAFTDRKLTAHDITVNVYKDAAYVEFYWHYSAKQKSDGKEVQTDGRESQMYRRLDGNRWVLVHVHYSGLPVKP